DWYLNAERDVPATYFIVPFKNRPGEKVSAKHSRRRGTKYDVADIPWEVASLVAAGNEIGVHGLDAWHDAIRAQEEQERVAGFVSTPVTGIRMHWLLQDEHSSIVLDNAGYAYDSTAGYNDTVGYQRG